ncbi:hypothetical protein BCR39DRAFT_530046 [Naematelia encephala]|uniref:Histone chaperone domain-containing protein n=1 Tax=Naematelia encephala TaxID=71784 RepID=A0A1Y2B5X9_9TREE|nr:hypothetical protein BCR39DRAFT_530046 [Naematelia encephala]
MDDSLLPHLRRTTEKVVRNASRPGGPLEQGEFTMGKARRMICSKMGLEEGELEGKWKGVVKDLVNRYLDESNQASPEDRTPSPAAKPKSKPTPQRTQPSPSSSKSKPQSKPKSDSKLKSQSNPKAKSKRERSFVSEQDEEEELDPEVEKSEVEWEDEKEDMKSGTSSVYDESPKKRSKQTSSKTGSSKKKQGRKTEKRDLSDEDDDDEQEEEEEEEESSRIHDDPEEVNSESEMSSVYDIPPSKSRGKKGDVDRHESKAKKRKSSSTGKDNGNGRVVKRNKEKKDPDEGLDPDEAKVNELKRIVVACGVRKQWSKEFADIPKAREQIRALQRILSELGMKGSPTISKARAIKERRELAAELDDVREFEATRGLSADKPRASRSRAKQAVVESNSASEEDDDEDDGQPKQQSALVAVLDFLEDLSD